MRRSDNCNLLRASGGVRFLWEQTNRGGCDQESLRVLVSCFERFLFPLRCTSLATWIQNSLLMLMLVIVIKALKRSRSQARAPAASGRYKSIGRQVSTTMPPALDPKKVLRNELFSRAIRLQFLLHGSICFFFSRAPWPALIDKPMLHRVGLANLRFRATMV